MIRKRDPGAPSSTTYDAVIAGSGQAGSPLALALAGAGWKTALVEREHIGGTCVNVGCTPTKTMIASGRVAHLARRGPSYGVDTGDITVDLTRVRQRKRDIVASFRSGIESRLAQTAGVDVLSGEARFISPQQVEVAMQSGQRRILTSTQFFINTGTRPAVPSIEGLAETPYLDSTTIMELDAVPEHLLVLGGGYVGLEFAQLFRRLGSRVTIIQHNERLLPREDADVADAIAAILREDGIDVLLQSDTASVRNAAPAIELVLRGTAGERTLRGSHLLVATGRTANTEALHLAEAGIELDARGFIPVDEHLETSVPGIYALGDVNGGPAFTHIAYDDYRIVRNRLLEGGDRSTRDRLVPYTVFTDPQLGRVGLSEAEARRQGRQFRVARLPMTHVARALEVDESRGFIKAVIDTATDQILGCAALAVEGGEVMAMLQLAMMGRIECRTLRDAVFAHPTLAEALNNLFA